ncbi:F-box protein At5g07610-like [Bidens hawaiensis]|uniref:F-box protein At5g07610-like n=1 Tax=Bidens hawaiensis TaxID=980011 RepID=UPI00404AA35A
MEDSDLPSIQSAALIGSNDDLLTEILILISILRFKSVSNHWRSLLTHRYFTHRYDNNNNNNNNNLSKSLGTLARDTYIPFDPETQSTPPYCNLYFYFNRCHVRIVQSCNGLVLIYAVNNGTLECYVFNPTTKQHALIPPVPGGNLRFFALAFHQTECVHYKVVCIRTLEPDKNMFQIQMYSSDTGEWKICVESFSAKNPTFRLPVYWNGAIHWAPDFRSDDNFLYFKLDVEQLQTLPVPEGLVSYVTSTMYFGESGGHLHLILRKDYEHNFMCGNVYEMLSDQSGWFVKYQVQLDGLQGAFPDMDVYQYDYELSGLKVVDVVRGKEHEEEGTFLVLITNGKLIRYNVHDKSFNLIYNHTEGYFFEDSSSCHRYIETLSSF